MVEDGLPDKHPVESKTKLERSVERAKLIGVRILLLYIIIVVTTMAVYGFLFGLYFSGIFRLEKMLGLFIAFNAICIAYIICGGLGIYIIKHGNNKRHVLYVQYGLLLCMFVNLIFPVTVLSGSKSCSKDATLHDTFHECHKFHDHPHHHDHNMMPCPLLPQIVSSIENMCILTGVTLILQIALYSLREGLQGINRWAHLERQAEEPKEDYPFPSAFDGIIPMFDIRQSKSSESLALSDISEDSFDGELSLEAEHEENVPVPQPVQISIEKKVKAPQKKPRKPLVPPVPRTRAVKPKEKKHFDTVVPVRFKPISIKIPHRDRSATPSRNIHLDPESKASKALQLLGGPEGSGPSKSRTTVGLKLKPINRQGPSKHGLVTSTKESPNPEKPKPIDSKASNVAIKPFGTPTESKIIRGQGSSGPSSTSNKAGADPKNKKGSTSKKTSLNDKNVTKNKPKTN